MLIHLIGATKIKHCTTRLLDGEMKTCKVQIHYNQANEHILLVCHLKFFLLPLSFTKKRATMCWFLLARYYPSFDAYL